MERVEHKVLALWPEFNNGPVGRMDYFKSYLGIIGICFAGLVVGSILIESAGDVGAGLGVILFLGLGIWSFVQSIALIFKRFWDVGFEDAGTRAGMTIGYILLGLVPFLGLIAGLALMFWPRKEEVEA
jgi:uncharacterized membrane protein YhaH (DUF805 family)